MENVVKPMFIRIESGHILPIDKIITITEISDGEARIDLENESIHYLSKKSLIISN